MLSDGNIPINVKKQSWRSVKKFNGSSTLFRGDMMHSLQICSILIWTSMAVADICSHLPGYTVHGRSCFKLVLVKKTWAAAEASCVADGGHLASIHSSEEMAFIADLMRVASNTSPWIGLTGTPPTMAWSDGTDVDYVNWDVGKTSNNIANCTRLWFPSAFAWRDVACSTNVRFICRTDEVSQTEAFFTKIPDGVPMKAAAVSSSSLMVRATFECARRCKRDAQCLHFVLAEDGGEYLCEKYTSLNQQAATSPTENYQRID